MRLVLNIFLSVIFFLVFIYLIYMFIGAPECDSYANITLMNLENAINDVATYYPTWYGREPPDDLMYYKTAPITLCQEKGVSFWETFFGGGPEYQIYYEKFPESGGGIWTEAYPWSGGNKNTLIFWAIMRGVILPIKYGPSIVNLARAGIKGSHLVKWMGQKLVSVKSKFSGILSNVDDASRIVEDSWFSPPVAGKTAEVLSEVYKGEEANMAFNKLFDGGFLTGEIDSKGRAVIDNVPRQWFVDMYDSAGNVIDEAQLFVLFDDAGNIVDLRPVSGANPEDIAALVSQGYNEFWASSEEIYISARDMVDSSQRTWMDSMYVPASEVVGDTSFWQALPNRIKDTNFYKMGYEPATEGFKKFVEELRHVGYRGKVTLSLPDRTRGILFAMDDVYDINAVAKDIFDDAISKGKVFNRAKLWTGQDVPQFKSYLGRIKEELVGHIFFPEGLKAEINQVGIDVLVDAAKAGTVYASADDFLDEAIALMNSETPDIINNFGEANVRQHLNDFVVPYIGDVDPANVAPMDITLLTRHVYHDYIIDISNKVGAGDADAAKEFGLFLGLLEQNKDKYPVDWNVKYLQQLVGRGKNIVFYNALNHLNPGSWYAKGFIAQVALKDCPENSVCLVKRGAMETPNILNENATKYFVRTYRPVHDILKIAGVQAVLMQVPSHPRFHVVSPCFGNTKVWKTEYNGEPTIFIEVEKIEIVDKDRDGTPDGSNYCYAYNDLVNQYVAIWGIIDILQYMPWSRVFDFLKIGTATKGLRGAFEKVTGDLDPFTALQGLLEGFISWPTGPNLPLDMDTMRLSTSAYGVREVTSGQIQPQE